MIKYPEVEITIGGLRRIIYFSLMKFRADSLHHQGTSAKRDLVGGYIERWFNKVAESEVINNLLKNKKYKAVVDYFLYSNDTDKNAPDILGLKTLEGQNIPFVKFNNGAWQRIEGMPRIEIKTIRKDQMLTGVREPQMIDDYYVFIESDLEPDYLTAVFEKETFDDKYLNELTMSDEFIEEDSSRKIIPPSKMVRTKRVGTMRLMGIYSKDELKKRAVLCGKKISPFYFSGASNKASVPQQNSDGFISLDKNGIAQYCQTADGTIYLPFSIQGARKPPVIVKRNKGSVYVLTEDSLKIDGVAVKPGLIKIEFKRFERSSKWDENIVSKYIIETYGKDSTKELIDKFDKIILSKGKN